MSLSMSDSTWLPPDQTHAFDTPPAYRSYLLRFWEERGAEPASAVWRFSVEDPHSAQRQGFADIDAFIAWLRAEMDSTKSAPAR